MAPSLERDLACEIAIVGGGITGAMCANELTRAGVDVALLDRRELCHGSTAASTGLLQYEIDTPLWRLRELVGPDHADRAYRACVQAVNAFDPLVQDLNDDCGLIARPSLFLCHDAGDFQEMRREFDARRSIGIDVEFLDESEVRKTFGFSRPAALYSRPAREVDPFRLSIALLRDAIARGMRAFAKTEVDHYTADDHGVTISTASGRKVRARRIVFATGYETPDFFPDDICQLKSTYAVSGEPIEDLSPWCDRCLIWESGTPYFYARTTRDGRPMIGGEDEDFADPVRRDSLIPGKTQTLTTKFNAMFPSVKFQPACAWAGTFAQTRDGLPYIGAARQFPSGYFALGYGGNGIVFGLLAARIICDQFLGRVNHDAARFRFDR